MILLGGKLSCLRPCSAAQTRNFFFSSSAAGNSSLKFPFIVDYLIKSVGLSPVGAIKLSKSISHIKSPAKPDSVLQFLKEYGFSDAHIKNIISKSGRILNSSVEANLRPKMKALMEFGFSESERLSIFCRNPNFLYSGDIQHKFTFWRNLLGSNKDLLKALVRGNRFICQNLDKNIMPKISFLRGCNLSNERITFMLRSNPNFMSLSLDSIKRLVKRAEELGLPFGSAAFCSVVVCLSQISRATMDSKLKLLVSFGWSKAGISLAIRKAPLLLLASEKKMKDAMEFLVKRAGIESAYMMTYPKLLLFSLQGRLIPRYHLLQLLKSKGLLNGTRSLYKFMDISEKSFTEMYILPYQKEMPELPKMYLAACLVNILDLGHSFRTSQTPNTLPLGAMKGKKRERETKGGSEERLLLLQSVKLNSAKNMILLSRKVIHLSLFFVAHNISPMFSFHFPISFFSSSDVRNSIVKSPFTVDYLIRSVGLLPEIQVPLPHKLPFQARCCSSVLEGEWLQ